MSLLTQVLGNASLAAEEAARLVPCPDPYRCTFHLCPPVGWLNDPNGLCQLGDTYHAYFQYSPLDAEGSLKFWGHSTSKDLLHWRYEGVALYPDEWFDCHGAYSGSALVEDGKIKVLYTGNVKLEDADYNYIDDGRIATQVYTESEDGQHFGRKVPILKMEDYPEGLTCHVRDPKVWKEVGANGKAHYYMVLGARRRGNRPVGTGISMSLTLGGRPVETHVTKGAALVDQGEVLVYRSEALDSGWKLIAQVSTPEPFGYMWECPDWFTLPREASPAAQPAAGDAGVDVAELGLNEDSVGLLSFSPQGLHGGEWERRNVYEAGYLLFRNGLLGESPTEFHLWDGGFDFYAPQTFLANDGRRILIGWMGIHDTPEHHNLSLDAQDAWQHCFTIPREVLWEDGQVITRPVAEIAKLRGEATKAMDAFSTEGRACKAFDLEVGGDLEPGASLRLRLAGELGVSYEQGRLTLAFADPSKQSVSGGRTERYEEVGELKTLRVIGDASTIEIFVNGGKHVFSTRYYPKAYALAVEAPGANITFWPLG